MYSLSVIQRNIERASAYLQRKHSLPHRWELQHSTKNEIEEMRYRLGKVLDERGQPTRKLTHEEALWALSEHTLCKLDFRYYAENYVWIQDWKGKVVLFKPNIGQEMMLAEIARREDGGFPQMWQMLKARQIGFTTLWQALLSHRIFLYRNVYGITGSASEDKSKDMVEKLEFIWDNMDWWLRPSRTGHETGKMMEFGELDSRLRVAWGNQKSGIGRGGTPSVVHLSELASFDNLVELVDASLVRAMHSHPFALMGFESTAEGVDDDWHNMWKSNTWFAAQGLARVQPLFFPWFVATDLYPTQSDLRERPVPKSWEPPEYVKKHSIAAQVYVEQTPMLKRHLGEGWTLPIEQQWYYYLQYEEARRKKTINLLLQELPANPEQAFQSSNPTVFDIETLNTVDLETKASVPLGVYQLSGKHIPLRYSSNTPIGEPLQVICRAPSGKIEERFSLEPVARDGWPDSDWREKLYVWEWGMMGEEYGIGVDISEGVDQDNSVVQVVKKANPWHGDEQVAEWASAIVTPDDLWPYVFAFAHIYTTRNPSGSWNYPRVVIEMNMTAGTSVQAEMLKRGWGHFHERVDLTKVQKPHAIGSQTQDPRVLGRLGFDTNRATRPAVISLGRKAIRDGLLKVRSPFLSQELPRLEYNIDKKRIEASEGNHDDRFMALGILLKSWYDPELYGTEPLAHRALRKYEDELAVLPVYTGGLEIGQRARGFRPSVKKVDSRSLSYD